MESLMKGFFRSSIITSIILFILGILLIFESEATIVSISYIIGGVLVAIGTLAFIRFFKKVSSSTKNELDIVYGLVTIVLGILIITNPHAIASFIPFILGIGIIISSANKLQYAFELKVSNNNLWKSTMIISMISTLCGVILLFNPFKGAVVITKIIGIFIVIYSILDIISTVTIKKNVTEIKNALEGTVVDAEVVVEEETAEQKKETTDSKRKDRKKEKS